MKIHTLWKIWDDDGLELLFALDEYTVENNWMAWTAGCDKAREAYGITPADTREVLLDFNEEPIRCLFLDVPTVSASIAVKPNEESPNVAPALEDK